jgi:hypothetical protein
MASPIPLVEPVTIADFPLSDMGPFYAAGGRAC